MATDRSLPGHWIGLWLLIAATVPGSAARGETLPLVPPPTATEIFDVREGQVYPFPWISAGTCRKVSEAGCFRVERLDAEQVILRFARFEVEGGALVSAKFGYRTPVTAAGSEYELYVVKLGGGREEWVYAALEAITETAARLRFMKYPAFVTEKARISLARTVDLRQRSLLETYTVEAEEPVTLIGLSSMPGAIPGGRLIAVEVNGTPVSFPYARILNLNLPAGRHTVRAHVALTTRAPRLNLEGTLFEPREMSLISELDLRVLLARPMRAVPSVAVATVGLPPAIWESFRSTIVVDPHPSRSEEGPLRVLYQFPSTQEIRVRTRPRVPVGNYNYPVFITVISGDVE